MVTTMPSGILEQILAEEVAPMSSRHYSLPFVGLSVTSTCDTALHHLDFFLEAFCSGEAGPGESVRLVLMTDGPRLPSTARHIVQTCRAGHLDRVPHSLVPAHLICDEGRLYFRANHRVFGVLAPDDREGLMVFDEGFLALERPYFFRMFVFLLVEILSALNCAMLHAASLTGPGGAVCLVGESGAGKTTLLLRLLRTGRYEFLGDELCLLWHTENGSRIGAVTPMIHAPPDLLESFDELTPAARRAGRGADGKSYLDPREVYGDVFAHVGEPKCVFLLEPGSGSHGGAEALSAFDALNGLVANAFMPLAHGGVLRNAETFASVVSAIRAYRLPRSSDLAESQAIVETVMTAP